MAETTIEPIPTIGDKAFKDAVFNLVKQIIDDRMPTIVDESAALYESKVKRVLGAVQKELDCGLEDGINKIKEEVKEILESLGETTEEKVRTVLKELDGLAEAFGAPERVVSAMKKIQDVEEPVAFLARIVDMLLEGKGRPTKKEAYGVLMAILVPVATLFLLLGEHLR